MITSTITNITSFCLEYTSKCFNCDQNNEVANWAILSKLTIFKLQKVKICHPQIIWWNSIRLRTSVFILQINLFLHIIYFRTMYEGAHRDLWKLDFPDCAERALEQIKYHFVRETTSSIPGLGGAEELSTQIVEDFLFVHTSQNRSKKHNRVGSIGWIFVLDHVDDWFVQTNRWSIIICYFLVCPNQALVGHARFFLVSSNIHNHCVTFIFYSSVLVIGFVHRFHIEYVSEKVSSNLTLFYTQLKLYYICLNVVEFVFA